MSCLRSIFCERIFKKDRSEFEDEFLTLYLEKLLNRHLERYIIDWLLINEPRRLVPYFDQIIKIDVSVIDAKQAKLYAHFGFDKKTSDVLRNKLKEEVRDETMIATNLVQLLSTDDFVALANEFLPKKIKIDLEDEEMQRDYKMQCQLAKVLHKVQEPSKALPVVMKFCVGDYLQSSLPALYSLFYRSPETLLPPCVDQLAKGAVSVRKHAIFLTCEVLHCQRVADVLKNAKQPNSADQKHVFSATFKYFVKNPSQNLLDAVVAGFKTIDQNDEEALDSVTARLTMPKRYKAMYIEKCWEWLENLKVWTPTRLERLLNYVRVPVLERLSPGFVRKIVNEYFGAGRLNKDAIAKFVVQVLRYRVSERDANFALVFDRLPQFTATDVGAFFDTFMSVCGGAEDRDREFIGSFVRHWNDRFTGLQKFRERLALRLFLMELDRQSWQEYARGVVLLLEELLDQYGPLAFNVFKERLRGALLRLQYVDTYRLLLEILRFKVVPSTCVLVVELMDPVAPGDSRTEIKEMFREAMRILTSVNEPIVQIYLENYAIS